MNKLSTIFTILSLIISFPILGQRNQNKKVAILETVDKEGTMPYGVKLMVRGKLSSAITNTPGYEGYDRVDLGSIMSEHEFQRTGIVSDSQIKRLGEMTGASFILINELAEIDSRNIVIISKIIDVESGKIENTTNIHTEVSLDELDKNCRLLAEKLLDFDITRNNPKGVLIIGENQYIGEYQYDKPHGMGKMIFGESDRRKSYTGHWDNGNFDGQGILEYKNGSCHEGNFKNGKREGQGRFFPNKTYYEDFYYTGQWCDDQLPEGEIFNDNKLSYRGELKDMKKNGNGTTYYPNGDYETANYKNNSVDGLCTYHYKSGKYEGGNYINGMKEGKWILYNSRGNKMATFTYKNGTRIKTKYHK